METELKSFQMVKTIEIYEPALCCSTGVCGPALQMSIEDHFLQVIKC